MLSKKSSGILSIQDLKGQTVVSTSGTTSATFLIELNRSNKLDMNVLLTKGHAEAFHLVESNRAAVFIMDDVLLHGLVASSTNQEDYVISEKALSVEPYAIIVRKDDPEFKGVADAALVSLFKSGEINSIYGKWFQSPIPPKQVNLRMGMSDALKDAIAHPALEIALAPH
jgi:glutamate/aspartate transport system substrate-binding protein